MIKTIIFVALIIGTCLCGLYLAKVANTDHVYRLSQNNDNSHFTTDQTTQTTLAIIGKTSISLEDVQWEYDFHLTGLMRQQELTQIPLLPGNLDTILSPLKEELASTLIERILLYQFIEQDHSFDLKNPARYTKCLKEWQEAHGLLPSHLNSTASRQKLKDLLCHSSILSQYAHERLFSTLTIKESHIQDYFEKHHEDFYSPTKVLIRQIVLSSEEEAKKVKSKINQANFAYYARTKSITPEASQGGLLGPFAKGDLPVLFDICFSMNIGEIKGVIKSTYGFHIIKLIKKDKERKLTLAQARKSITQKLLKKQREEEYQKWIESALSSIPIKSPKKYSW